MSGRLPKGGRVPPHEHEFGGWLPCDMGRKQFRVCLSADCDYVDPARPIESEVARDNAGLIEFGRRFMGQVEADVDEALERYYARPAWQRAAIRQWERIRIWGGWRR
jgi:hypothetical protein